MKKLATSLAFCAFAAVLVAQGQSVPFFIQLSAETPVVHSGEPVYLSVTMTNNSSHEVDCTVNASNALDRNYIYDVRDEDGNEVAKIEKKYHGGSSLWPCILKPGETDSPGGGRISVLYDFSRPGKYRIQVSRSEWGDENRPESAGTGKADQGVVKSNIITVTVLPKADAAKPE
jgi:hypothetical protein